MEDVIRYIHKYGLNAVEKSNLILSIAPHSPERKSSDTVIQVLAKQSWSSELFTLLSAHGWRRHYSYTDSVSDEPSKKRKSVGTNSNSPKPTRSARKLIYIPPWNNYSDEQIEISLPTLHESIDFFENEDSVLEHIRVRHCICCDVKKCDYCE